MSFIRPILNAYLRHFEKPKLARHVDIDKLRGDFAKSARLFFHAPRGTRVQHDTLPGGAQVLRVSPKNRTSDLVVFYVHGGGFVFGSPDSYAAMLGQLAARLGARVVMPYYRLAPEASFPAAVDDIEAAYRGLVASGVAAQDIVIGGDSAGGMLIFSLLGQICDKGWPRPRGAFAFSPFIDFAHTGASYTDNAPRDVVLPAARADELGQMYLAGADINDPRISPLLADFRTAPPTWICVGDTEILRDDAGLIAAHLTAHGGAVKLTIERDLPHVWPLFHHILPEARQTLDQLAAWIKALPPLAPEN